MISVFEDMMMTLFLVADVIWLVQIWKSREHFSREDKTRAVSFTAAFLLAFFPFAMGHNIVGAIISLIGYTCSASCLPSSHLFSLWGFAMFRCSADRRKR